MQFFRRLVAGVDWVLVGAIVPIVLAGLVTMNTFVSEDYFVSRQIMWLIISIVVCIIATTIDWRVLRNTKVILVVYGIGVLLLLALFSVASIKGAQSWFDLGAFSFQPTDLIKIALIIVLAKYLSRRHVEIEHYRHIIITGAYALVPFLLLLTQPDFGSAMIVFAIWLGLIIISGVSKKHLLILGVTGVLAFLVLWLFVFAPYQKLRIISFVDPASDVRGAGYNALQSMVAVGSGQVTGKGVGFGTQSRLEFLPEYETDFIFAAFAEEWGFIGVVLLFTCYGVVIWRILRSALIGQTNFEIFFGVGVALLFMGHFIIHVGMNIGLLPVTGLTLPFMSYGGSHLIAEFLAIGMVMGMRRYSYGYHKEDTTREFLGIEKYV